LYRLKCTKFDFDWGSVTDPAVGPYSDPQTSWLHLRGPTTTGRAGKGRGRHMRREGQGRKGKRGE